MSCLTLDSITHRRVGSALDRYTQTSLDASSTQCVVGQDYTNSLVVAVLWDQLHLPRCCWTGGHKHENWISRMCRSQLNALLGESMSSPLQDKCRWWQKMAQALYTGSCSHTSWRDIIHDPSATIAVYDSLAETC